MLVLVEGLVMCFILMLVCVIGIANGAVGCVFFYEKSIQERVVELGLITKDRIKRNSAIAGIAVYIPILFFAPAMVYVINGARGFGEIFWQILVIYMIEGVFDRLFIDWYWVGKTKTWIIPGTEDLMPYIPKRVFIKKWVATIVGYPVLAGILSAILSLF
ncbi:MAG: hypothetical protein NC089_11575 [Bacteroides sp.]|nr:hypothetical protein [Bacteroides sp.]MCM1550407.1 hypothetical protein [Clostridium sp.]